MQDSKSPVNRYVRTLIRQMRLEKGLLSRELAERAGIPIGAYALLECGYWRISLENLLLIAGALGVEAGELLPRAGLRPAPEKVCREWMDQVVELSWQRRPRPPTLDEVLNAVCAVCGLEMKELMGPSRRRELCRARVLAAMVVDSNPHLTLTQLGRRLGRHPSTLCHCLRRLGAPVRGSQTAQRLSAVRRRLSHHLEFA